MSIISNKSMQGINKSQRCLFPLALQREIYASLP